MSLDLDKTDLKDNVLIITNDDGSIQCIPEDGATIEEQSWFDEFRQAYPDGKPVEVLPPQQSIQTTEDRITALENAISSLMGV